MEARLEVVVAALQGQLGQNGIHPSPSRVYGIAWELVKAVAATERQCQLLRLLAFFETSQEHCTAGHVISAGALMCAGGMLSDEDVRRWERAMYLMLVAHPPFAKDVISAACYCVAQLAVCGGSVALVGTAGTSLQNSASTAILPEEVATELLAECADALVRAHQGEEEGAGGTKGETELTEKGPQQAAALRDALIGYALDALFFRRGAVELSSLLSRRVLIPLLLCGGHASLTSHHARIQSLLQSLAEETARQGRSGRFYRGSF
ncbi:hypothetical protein TraAM80_04742 [Trypanosoma rangeli]|uniref:Uncharacterized protein n=1 Tax=Trypanosoma rangeli TaxID=5698 RepID=A0A422NI02_TRYRA|nr:uncharacterized protein TraAM80_04742 [Trypanosoma rangeli]RNF05095.1 hypothetical protein TraAM80_04742 [Trypanosoma rangeli]|eukprot:RNF05095.1 hypothetical protein TraAM80_04742 [Trypanosoma rangeli]